MKPMIRFAVSLLICILGPFHAHAVNECDVPAFLNVSPPPNLLIGFDNSASMYDMAYKKDGSYCYDNSYDNAKSYYGYYDNNTVYNYNSGKFQAASMPSSGCINSIIPSNPATQDFCIQSNAFYFRGNFLNWLTMSKLDLMKKAMTGGKYCETTDPQKNCSDSGTMVGESRGCMGRRFVKEVVGSGISFGILGTNLVGTASEYQKVYSGGTTRIEIYTAPSGGFNMTPCMTAVNYIEEGQLGQSKKYTEDCLTLSSNSSVAASFNHSMQSCWSLTSKGVFDVGDVSRLENSCENTYKVTPPTQLTTTSGAYVCSRDTTNASGDPIKGYVGNCYNDNNKKWDDACVYTELAHYCGILKVPEVIDPSIYLQDAGTYANMPAILIDSGFVSQMGGPPIAIINNIKAETTAPTGILHDLKDRANIGLIAYNNYGSKYEDTTNTNATSYYYSTADADGAKVFSMVHENNTGIIGTFNDLEAYAWTPIGELLYEASKYIATESSVYSSGVTYTYPDIKSCQKNLVVMLSDGGSTYDKNLPGTSFTGTSGAVSDSSLNVETYLARIPEATQNLTYGGTNYAKAVAYWAHEVDFNTSMAKTQSIDFYTVLTLGGAGGSDLLKGIAKYGGYKEIDSVSGLSAGDIWDSKVSGQPDNYFEVIDPGKLATDLKLLLSEILEQQGGAGAVATVTQQVGTGDIIVRGAFTSYDVNPKELTWRGHLESYWPYEGCITLNDAPTCTAVPGCTWNASTKCTGTMYSFQHPDNTNKFCSDMGANKNCWDAESNLPAPASRNIFTVLLGEKATGKSYLKRQNFVTTNTELCNDTNDWLALTGETLMGASTTPSVPCQNLVNWVRGAEPSSTDPVWRYRNNWTLGDIVYSTPVVVEQPSLGSVVRDAVGDCDTACSSGCSDSTPDSDCEKHCFYCYRDVHKHRKKMIYVGANDGMLHAFVAGKWDSSANEWAFDPTLDSEIGKEAWAYIPSNLLRELKDLAKKSYGTETCWHRFMVDLSPQAYDVYIDSDGDGEKEWRTVILGGERQGGDVYFAVDVTDPDDPRVLWEYSVLRNMVQLQGSGDTKDAVAPYLPLAKYREVSNFPASWSIPSAGRLTIPDGVEFWAWPKTYAPTESNPGTDPLPVAWKNTGTHELSDWFAFIGGAVRLFDPVDDLLPSAVTEDQRKATIKPYFMAIDIEKGINIFQHLWPMLHHGTKSETAWSYRTDKVSGSNIIPYAMTGPVALDINQDGDVDHIYTGDLNGQFYGLTFNLSPAATNKGVKMDIWPTKTIPAPDDATNLYRSDRQPIGATPAMAFDRDPLTGRYRLRAYFGTGKYNDVIGASTDKTDTAKMSFYNLLVDTNPKKLPVISSTGSVATLAGNSITVSGDPLANGITAGGFVIKPDVQSAIPTTTPPLGVTNANYPHTILDFGITGERVVDMALVAGRLVFFLTFVPTSDDCGSGGDAYLYILNYMGNDFGTNPEADPLNGSGFVKRTNGTPLSSLKVGEYTKADAKTYVAKVSDKGVPSQPVLDSSNQYVLIQTSDAKIHKIKVTLEGLPLTIKGWKEEETENP